VGVGKVSGHPLQGALCRGSGHQPRSTVRPGKRGRRARFAAW